MEPKGIKGFKIVGLTQQLWVAGDLKQQQFPVQEPLRISWDSESAGLTYIRVIMTYCKTSSRTKGWKLTEFP